MSKVNSKTQTDFANLVKKGDYEKIKDMLDRVTNRMDQVALVNSPSASGSTPLFTACWDGRIEICELLIDHGAKVNWKNLRGNTALSMAIEQNQVDIVQLLLQNGAEGDVKEVVDLRAKTGKKISPKIDQLIENAKVMNRDLMAQQEVKATGLLGDLTQAVIAGKVQDVEQLLRDNKKVVELINEVDSDGQPVLFTAAARGYVDIVKTLLEHGADIHFRDRNGRSALHMAIASNQYQSTKLLLDEGANTTGVDMRQIRFWSTANISQRIDNLLKKYPAKPFRPSKKSKSPLEGLTLKEFLLQQKIFKFFDVNKDGYISENELKQRLSETKSLSCTVLPSTSTLFSKHHHCPTHLPYIPSLFFGIIIASFSGFSFSEQVHISDNSFGSSSFLVIQFSF